MVSTREFLNMTPEARAAQHAENKRVIREGLGELVILSGNFIWRMAWRMSVVLLASQVVVWGLAADSVHSGIVAPFGILSAVVLVVSLASRRR